MTEYEDGFEDKPSLDDAPDACQMRGCDASPQQTVRFRNPQEYLCYCKSHAAEQIDEPHAKYRSRLR